MENIKYRLCSDCEKYPLSVKFKWEKINGERVCDNCGKRITENLSSDAREENKK